MACGVGALRETFIFKVSRLFLIRLAILLLAMALSCKAFSHFVNMKIRVLGSSRIWMHGRSAYNS